MSEEKIMILKMLKDGKIDEEEALKLLNAVGEKKGEKIISQIKREMKSILKPMIMTSLTRQTNLRIKSQTSLTR